MKNRTRIFLILMLLCICFAGCSSDDALRKTDAEIRELIQVVSVATAEEDYSNILHAQVELPDYSTHLLEICRLAESESRDMEDFEERLFALMLEQAKNNPISVTREITVNLTAEFPDKTGWSEGDLSELAREEALNAELEEFAFAILSQAAPEVTMEVGE